MFKLRYHYYNITKAIEHDVQIVTIEPESDVYQSHQDAFVEAPEWMHRLLIGQKGATIKEIQDKFGNDKVKIDFTVKDKVSVNCKD